MTMRAVILVLTCVACSLAQRGAQKPRNSERELASLRALGGLLQASNPESAFSIAGAGLRSPRSTLNRAASEINMAESWKEYLTKCAAKMKELEAAKKALDAEPPLPPIEPLGIFEMKSPADGMAAITAQMAKADATQEIINEKSEALSAAFKGVQEEIAKLESIIGDDVSVDEKKKGADDQAANKASEARLIARLEESIAQSGKMSIPESLFASFKLDVAAIGKELSRSYRGYGVE